MEEKNLLNFLAEMFLSYGDVDEGYFEVLREIERLENKEIYLDMNKVQCVAYGLEVDSNE